MAKLEPSKARTVLESVAQFDLSQTSLSSFSCLAIASISDSELLIYVGTDSGAIFLLTLDASSDPPTSSAGSGERVKLLRYVSVSHSAIKSVHVVSEIGKILVVSDGYVHLVDLQLEQPVKRLSLLKGVNIVARRICSSENGGVNWIQGEGIATESLNGSSSSVGEKLIKRLGSRIKAHGLMIKESELIRDLSNSCIFAVAAGKRVAFVGLNSGSRITKDDLDVDGSVVVLKELQGIDGVRTMAWLDNSLILGTSAGYSLMSCSTGQVTLIFSLPDMAAVPRLKLLPKAHKVLLLVDNAGITVDSYGQPVGGSLVFRHAPDSIAEFSSYVGVARDGKMELYNKRSRACVQALPFGGTGGGACFLADEEDGNGGFIVAAVSSKVFCFRRIPSEEQIKDLLRKKNFKEAITLVEELEAEGDISKEMPSFVHAQVGFLLLFDLHFEEAVDHFLRSETMQPSEIFPFVMRDPNRWSLLVPRNRYWGLHPPPAHIEDVVEDGLLAIQRAVFLKKAGVETDVDKQFLLNPPSRAELLDLAFKNIVRYLQVARNKNLSPAVKEGVDTLLMYLYRTLNWIEEMEKLASSENSCVVRRRSWKLCWKSLGI